jgi:hypothetical protein
MKLSYFLVLPVVSARVIDRQQAPILEAASEDVVQSAIYEDNILPAIGVHFTTSYAVAAARYQNGTTRDLARVEGNAQYIQFMSRWSNREHAIPLDLYATVLADFMKTTRNVIETELGMRISEIAPTFPQLPGWGEAGVRAALLSAGLTSTRDNVVSDAPSYDEFAAADAGVAHHLREFAKDNVSQSKPDAQQNVLYVNFDNSSLSSGVVTLQHVDTEREMLRYNMDIQLGWWNMPIYDSPRAKFWTRIEEMIFDVLEPMPRPPNRIVLMGDHGADQEFKEAVTAALWEKYEFDVEVMLTKEDVGRLAARGAAELAWRDSMRQREREGLHQNKEAIEV